MQQQTISQLVVMWDQKWILYKQPAMTRSVFGPRRSSKALPKVKLTPKKSHRHCLVVCCPTGPLQLSESWRSHYIWEKYVQQNGWDAQKTAMPGAGIGQQKGLSSPRQLPTVCHTTDDSKVEQIELWNFVWSSIFTWPLTNWLPLLQASCQLCAGKMLSQQSEGKKYFPRVHGIL